MSEIAILICPHGQELYTWEKNSVLHYQHRDGSSCTVNNSFCTPAELVLAEVGKSAGIADPGKPETPAMRAAFTCSLPLRIAYYKKMASIHLTRDSQKDAEQHTLLEKLTRRLIWLMKGAYNETVLIWELDKVFGPVIWKNMALYMQEPPTLNLEQDQEQIKQHVRDSGKYKLPTLSLLNLQNARESADFLRATQQLSEVQEYYGKFVKRQKK